MRSSLIALLLTLGVSPAPAPLPWMLRYVDLRIAVDPAMRRIDGVARLTLSAAPGAGELALDLAGTMTVDSVRLLDAAVRATHQEDRLILPVAPMTKASRYLVTVWYHGQPVRQAVGFGSGPPAARVASYGLPASARQWWPTLDTPGQKADSADLWITAPAALHAVSNGREVGRVVSADGQSATTHWAERHPIYSDVVSFAVGDYTVARSRAPLAGGGSVPMVWYLFPEDSAKGARDLASVPAILAFYQAQLGRYPFGDEQYALVEMARPSFREGQTLSHLGATLFTGTGENEQVFAHEIAHQWFGNSLTVSSWEEIWLNESLAEYLAWQWIRQSRGEQAYRALLDSAVVAPVPAPILPANPSDFGALFGNATFQRGPAVLALLEREIGPKAFAVALRRYVAGHAYGVVETADFQRALEAAWGKSLDDFFGRWVRGSAPLSPLGRELGP